MNELSVGTLRIETQLGDLKTIRLDWKGRSDARRPDLVLDPYLSQVIADAKVHASAIEMHFESLEYFNSSTVSALIKFLHAARCEGLTVSFVYRSSVRWQRTSFEALKVFEFGDAGIHVIALPA